MQSMANIWEFTPPPAPLHPQMTLGQDQLVKAQPPCSKLQHTWVHFGRILPWLPLVWNHTLHCCFPFLVLLPQLPLQFLQWTFPQ